MTASDAMQAFLDRDALRKRLTWEWRPIVDSRGIDWTPEREQRRMWEAARRVAPSTTLTLDEFQRIDQTCSGHIDWFEKLALRTAHAVLTAEALDDQ